MRQNETANSVWNSIEVHAIYELVYDMCMSKEGVFELRRFCNAKDLDVFEPLFIAQCLLVPVNTIVKTSLLPWMIKKHIPPTPTPTTKHLAKRIKAKVYLRYSLLVELMQLVKKVGRGDLYEFDLNEKLSVIKSGISNDVTTNEKIRQILSFNSFITIWLLTLPKKFKE